jgi:Mycothiol maleylpyruvate isomerase N-terminal domain
MNVDLGALYRNSRLRISALASEEVATVPVPATPLWTVHDVIAHLCGVVDDVLSGNMEGAATDPWTAAQVERARSKSVSELLDSWAEGAATIEAFLSSPDGMTAMRAVLDIHTHECDLLGALDRPVVLPDEFLEWMHPMMVGGLSEAVAGAGLEPVTVDIGALEIFRARLGRRTVDEVMAYPWSSDPTPYLDVWFLFGRAVQPLHEQ